MMWGVRMKKFNKLLYGLGLVTLFLVPQNIRSYDFESAKREQQVKATRKEIYDLYNLQKSLVKEQSSGDTSQFGVIGYNGACSTVKVNGGTVSLDDYIAGVIKHEMGGNSLEALKAQAIAARSFLLSTHKNSTSCSVVSGQSYQVYNEDKDANSIYKQAVAETSGMVVSRDGEVAHTQYQSYPAGRWQTSDSSGWHVQFQRFADDSSTKWTWNGPSKETVKSISPGTEMNYDNPHNWGMSQTIAVYLAKAEGYNYQQLIELFYAQPIVKITDGVYDGNVKYVTGAVGNVTYWNQGDFSNYSYGHGCGSISACGCGPSSVAIVASSFLNRPISPVETTEKVCDLGGCTSNGTINSTLGKTLTTVYGIRTTSTSNDQEVVNALGTGKALVIAHMGPGTFTTGGHYIVLTGVNAQGQVSVADPGNRSRTEQKWFDFNLVMSQKKGPYTIAYKS